MRRRTGTRTDTLRRSWNLIVLLRSGGRTLSDLARHFNVTERTIRRDLECLEAVGAPIVKREYDRAYTVQAWDGWPRSAAWPVRPIANRPPQQRTACSERDAGRLIIGGDV